jgi:hypothetical protein
VRIEKGFSRQEFPQLLCEKSYRIGAEIGVQFGHHAVAMLAAWPGSLILVDPWKHYGDSPPVTAADWNVSQDLQEQIYQQCLANIGPFGDRAKILRMFSHEAASRIPDESLDFVYLDACHAYVHAKQDLACWFPKVRLGGLISGHDYTQDNDDPGAGCFGVKAAVNEFAAARTEELYVSNEEWPNWAFFKTISH